MSRRLEDVLRAGEEQRRSSVRTGALELSDFNDDALRLITQAMGEGDVKGACEGAAKWCALNKRHRAMCQDGGDALWTELTRRVFGPNASQIAGPGGPNGAQKNFYALCRRKRAERWLVRHRVFGNHGPAPHQILELDSIMTHIDNGGKDTPDGRVRLVTMLVDYMGAYALGFDGKRYLFAEFASPVWIYTTLLNASQDEIGIGLDLLIAYAKDQNELRDVDSRIGYEEAYIPVLGTIMGSGTWVNAQKVIELWIKLLDPTVEDPPEAEAMRIQMARYVEAMQMAQVNSSLVGVSVAADAIGGGLAGRIRIQSSILLSKMVDALAIVMPRGRVGSFGIMG